MRKVPNHDKNGQVTTSKDELNFGAIIAQFFINPRDTRNNKELKKFECNLELTIDYTFAPRRDPDTTRFTTRYAVTNQTLLDATRDQADKREEVNNELQLDLPVEAGADGPAEGQQEFIKIEIDNQKSSTHLQKQRVAMCPAVQHDPVQDSEVENDVNSADLEG